MTSLQEFIDKYNGKYLEVAGSPNAQNQCTDLANGYIKEVLGLPIIEWTNAVDFSSKAGDNYTFVSNTPDGYPPQGALAIFKKYGSLYGEAGHIGVVYSADIKLMTLFEQNYPAGSVCRLGTHNYLGCTGWLIPKVKPVIDPKIVQLEKDLDEAHRNIDNLQSQVDGLLGEKKQLTTQNTSLSSDLGTVRSENQALSQKVESLNKIVGEYQSEDAVQISDLRRAQDERKYYKDLLDQSLWDLEDELKLSHPSDDFSARWSIAMQALISLKESKVKQLDISDYLLVIWGKVIWLKS